MFNYKISASHLIVAWQTCIANGPVGCITSQDLKYLHMNNTEDAKVHIKRSSKLIPQNLRICDLDNRELVRVSETRKTSHCVVRTRLLSLPECYMMLGGVVADDRVPSSLARLQLLAESASSQGNLPV